MIANTFDPTKLLALQCACAKESFLEYRNGLTFIELPVTNAIFNCLKSSRGWPEIDNPLAIDILLKK